MKSDVSYCQVLRDQLTNVRHRKLHHDDPSVFCKSQWHCSSSPEKSPSVWSVWAYLVYRWLVSIYLVSGIGYDFIATLRPEKCAGSISQCKAKWPIYLTNWNFLILTLQALMATFLVTRHYFFPNTSDKMQLSHKIYWVLNNISIGLSPLVSILYWGAVHNPQIHFVDFINIREHVTNLVITLIDLLVCAHPMRLLHVYQPVALGLCYSAFTGFYYALGGTNRLGFSYIYSILNWDRPERAVLITLATLVFEIVIFFSAWSLHMLRMKIAKSRGYCSNSNVTSVANKQNSIKTNV